MSCPTDHTPSPRRSGTTRRLAAALATTLVAAAIAAPALADKPAGAKKLAREIGIMERTIDEVLVESPNFLVSGGAVTDGLSVDEYGVVFTFHASLVSDDWRFSGLPNGRIQFKDDGDRIVIYKNGREIEDNVVGDDENGERDHKKDKESIDWRDKSDQMEKKRYERGKQELVDLLLDYGDQLTSLRDEQWVVIAARLGGSDLFHDMKISQCVVKARIGDLRAASAGNLSHDVAAAKVTIDER